MAIGQTYKAILSERAASMAKAMGVFLVSAFWVLISPEMAMAQGTAATGAAQAGTLGNLICNMRENYMPIAEIIGILAYTAGAFFGARGVLMLKANADNAGQNPMSRGVAHLLGAGALIGFPAAIATLQSSMGLDALGATPSKCDPGAVVSLASNGGLDHIVQNFMGNISDPLLTAVSVISILVGLTFVFRGLMLGSKTSMDQQAVPHKILAQLVIGAVLISIGTMVSTVLTSIFGDATIITYPGMNWSTITTDATETANIDATIKAVLVFVQVIGAIGFIRGWMIMKTAVEGGQATIPQGLTHIVGGAMAINIGTMLQVFDATFGLDLITN